MKLGRPRVPFLERLLRRLKPGPNGCLEWQGSTTWKGYGHIGRGAPDKGLISTHRAMWEIVFGPIPEGLCVLHTCDNPPCCEPTHLWLGTHIDNLADRVAKGRSAQGERNGNAKLTREQVEAIRADTRPGILLATEYEVSQSTVSGVRCGGQWKGLE